MADFVYGSMKRDSTISPNSHRKFTKTDCMDWLDKLEDNSVNLWILDPPYNVLTGNEEQKWCSIISFKIYGSSIA